MSRIIVVTIAFLISVSVCKAQVSKEEAKQNETIHLSYGPMVGANASNFIHSGIDCKSQMKIGFYGGGFLQLGVIPQFSIEGDLMFNYKQSQFTLIGQNGPFYQWSATFAVLAMYHVQLPYKSRLNIGFGPYTDFGLSAYYTSKGKKCNLYNRNNDDEYPSMATSETGMGIKLGYEFNSGFIITVAYRVSISNITETNNTKTKIHPQTIDLGVAYRFGK